MSLNGTLETFPGAVGIVLLVDGRSGPQEARNQCVARAFRRRGWATLILHFGPGEAGEDAEVEPLAARLIGAHEFVRRNPETSHLGIHFLAAGSGAAAALLAEVMSNGRTDSIVCFAGKLDPMAGLVDQVRAPTLFLVDPENLEVLGQSLDAYHRMTCIRQFQLLPSGERRRESGYPLEELVAKSGQWFRRHGRVTRPVAGAGWPVRAEFIIEGDSDPLTIGAAA